MHQYIDASFYEYFNKMMFFCRFYKKLPYFRPNKTR